MSSTLKNAELERLAVRVAHGDITCTEALERACALGTELERLDAMHRACEDYSRARVAREEAFAVATARRPPSTPPGER